MTDKKNKSCIVCSQTYKYCNTCKEFINLEPWHSIFHDENCREIFNAVSMYGRVSNDEIKKRLDKCNLSNKENFKENIQNIINEIYVSDVSENVLHTEETIDETNIENVIEETGNEYVRIKPRYSKKKENKIVM